MGYNNNYRQQQYSARRLQPLHVSTLGLTVTQPLLQGFGIATNRRFIRIAKNNERVTDLVFRQQLIETVSAVIRLYWDLAGPLGRPPREAAGGRAFAKAV